MVSHIETPRAWGLTRGMARVLGLNLVQAVTEGWVSRRDLAALVDACAVCDQSGPCTAFLAVTTRATTLPAFCPNRDQIAALVP
ncbi:hypothetical protein GC209_16540 [bacterium]|nr:hypothetical protein [bacterium]